jgi:hypothetical protein
MSSATALKLLNFLLFQAGWLVCVLLTNSWAVLIATGIVAFHLAVVSARPAAEARFILLGVVLGSLVDGLWFRTGVMQDGIGSSWTPLWLVAIWALFMTTLAHSLNWMHERIWLPFLLAPIAGPFAYLAASKLDAVMLPEGAMSLAALAVGWVVVFPLLMAIQKRYFPETLT